MLLRPIVSRVRRDEMTDPSEHATRSNPKPGRDDQPEDPSEELAVVDLPDAREDQAEGMVDLSPAVRLGDGGDLARLRRLELLALGDRLGLLGGRGGQDRIVRGRFLDGRAIAGASRPSCSSVEGSS